VSRSAKHEAGADQARRKQQVSVKHCSLQFK
jgi:hypothetical protein